ncbi:MAG: GCN5-like N-acetyltransferase [Spirochaetes bacterium]|nr:MAG: GCN5-like N-acetyltransferase [Spirochaetota bacterium]
MPGMNPEPQLFELNDAILERIVFAMEDQTKSRAIDLRTGALLSTEEIEESEKNEYVAPPPPWSPADGFRIMENFCAKVNNIPLRSELLKALSRGKGVFKAFRKVLAEHPLEETQFKEFKNNSLRRYVTDWMDQMRESIGLARLGPEPEDFGEILEEEWVVHEGCLEDLPFDFSDPIDRAAAEAMEWLPPALALWEAESIGALAKAKEEGSVIHYICDETGIPLALSLGIPTAVRGKTWLEIRFFFVRSEFRALGLGIRLAQGIDRFRLRKDVETVVIRSILLHPGLTEELQAQGHKALPPPIIFT